MSHIQATDWPVMSIRGSSSALKKGNQLFTLGRCHMALFGHLTVYWRDLTLKITFSLDINKCARHVPWLHDSNGDSNLWSKPLVAQEYIVWAINYFLLCVENNQQNKNESKHILFFKFFSTISCAFMNFITFVNPKHLALRFFTSRVFQSLALIRKIMILDPF